MAQWVRLSLGKLTSQIQARLPALALLPLIQPPVCVLGKAADDDPRALTPVTHARDLGEVPGSWLLPDLGSGCCGRVDGQSVDGRSLFFFLSLLPSQPLPLSLVLTKQATDKSYKSSHFFGEHCHSMGKATFGLARAHRQVLWEKHRALCCSRL